MKKIGGVLYDDSYWTSTQQNRDGAWILMMSNDNIGSYIKKANYRVCPVCAL